MPHILIDPNESTLHRLEAVIGLGKFLTARFVEGGPVGQCYWNCDKYIERHGGQIEYGWQGLVWPGLFAELLHHAVVRTGKGELVDPTPPPYPHAGVSPFLIDNSIKPPRDYPIFVPNRFYHSGAPHPASLAVIAAHVRLMAANRRLAEIAKRHGLEFSLGKPIPFPPTPEVQIAFQTRAASARDMDAAWAQCRAATGES